MTMILTLVRRYHRYVRLAVHLDSTRLDPEGAPDPAWVIEQTWPLPPRLAGETVSAWVSRLTPWFAGVKADLKERADLRLAELLDAEDPGVALPGEGQEF